MHEHQINCCENSQHFDQFIITALFSKEKKIDFCFDLLQFGIHSCLRRLTIPTFLFIGQTGIHIKMMYGAHFQSQINTKTLISSVEPS